MTTNEFTVKEIVNKIYDKQEKMDNKIDKIHSQVSRTNGTVKIHTKLIWGAYGFGVSILGFVIIILK